MTDHGTTLHGLCLVLFAVMIGHAAGKSNDFDVLIFTQRWPQTVCVLWKEQSSSHTCSLPKDNEWTIHGVWPSQYHQLGPQFCNSSMPFDATALRPLEKELEEKWIDVENGRGHYSFWKHEWEKHGTCAAVLPQFNTESKYFKTGLQLLNKYEMKNVLDKANIVPGQKYRVADFLHAVQSALGVRAVVRCSTREDTKESYIFEIRLCFGKTLNLMNCDGVYGYPTNCDSSVSIVYPGGVQYNAIQV